MPRTARREQQVQAIVVATQRRFAELGTRTTVRLGAAGADPSLVAADRRVYPLDGLLAVALPAGGRERSRLIDEHVGRLVREGPGLDRLDPDDLRARVRTRLLSAEDAPALSRPFTDGLVEGLCVRLPETVDPVASGRRRAERRPALLAERRGAPDLGPRPGDADPAHPRDGSVRRRVGRGGGARSGPPGHADGRSSGRVGPHVPGNERRVILHTVHKPVDNDVDGLGSVRGR